MRALATQYGLPASGWAHVVVSTSVFFNQELFQYWVDEILVPGVAAKRREFALPPDTPALLLLDGCLAHSKDTLTALSEHHIDSHFFTPHSSYITQPLERGTFSSFKSFFKTEKCDKTMNKMAKWLVCGLKAMDKCMGFASIRSFFYHAGVVINFEEGAMKVSFDPKAWLEQPTVLYSEEKEASSTSKDSKKRKMVQVAATSETKAEKRKRLEGEKLDLLNKAHEVLRVVVVEEEESGQMVKSVEEIAPPVTAMTQNIVSAI